MTILEPVLLGAGWAMVVILARYNWLLYRQLRDVRTQYQTELERLQSEFERLQRGYLHLDAEFDALTAECQKSLLQARTVLRRDEVRH